MCRMTETDRFHGSSALAHVVELHRAALLQRLALAGATNVRVFGSVGRGEDSPGSDVDLLVDFDPAPSLFELAHLEDDLSVLLGAPVDVVDAGGLRPHLSEQVLREAVAV